MLGNNGKPLYPCITVEYVVSLGFPSGFLSMFLQEFWIGRDGVGGKDERLACIGCEGVGDDLLRQGRFDPAREQEPEIVIEGD